MHEQLPKGVTGLSLDVRGLDRAADALNTLSVALTQSGWYVMVGMVALAAGLVMFRMMGKKG